MRYIHMSNLNTETVQLYNLYSIRYLTIFLVTHQFDLFKRVSTGLHKLNFSCCFWRNYTIYRPSKQEHNEIENWASDVISFYFIRYSLKYFSSPPKYQIQCIWVIYVAGEVEDHALLHVTKWTNGQKVTTVTICLEF